MIKFTSPKLTVVTKEGKSYLFAAHSFTDKFGELLGQVFSVPDIDFDGPYFEKYAEDRIRHFEEIDRVYVGYNKSTLIGFAANRHETELKQGGGK